ncbi:hypothetical protein KSMBR1_2310 [Candidatus Kuenenia stuttgartiensis]|uniref:Uncharacterized protein n=1 Tax=Kuenenia stuttgartiensis TaxID=174633 RepID=A0A2C9CGM2_KUEST|nr:hypothetical protein KSMBR1_2310 [Candidatus Kuenenia stuttgartiensis]
MNPVKITVEEIKHVLPRLSRRQIVELDQRIPSAAFGRNQKGDF